MRAVTSPARGTSTRGHGAGRARSPHGQALADRDAIHCIVPGDQATPAFRDVLVHLHDCAPCGRRNTRAAAPVLWQETYLMLEISVVASDLGPLLQLKDDLQPACESWTRATREGRVLCSRERRLHGCRHGMSGHRRWCAHRASRGEPVGPCGPTRDVDVLPSH